MLIAWKVAKQISAIAGNPSSSALQGLKTLAEAGRFTHQIISQAVGHAQTLQAMGVVQHHDAASGTAKQHVTFDYAKRLAKGRRARPASTILLATSHAAIPSLQGSCTSRSLFSFGTTH